MVENHVIKLAGKGCFMYSIILCFFFIACLFVRVLVVSIIAFFLSFFLFFIYFVIICPVLECSAMFHVPGSVDFRSARFCSDNINSAGGLLTISCHLYHSKRSTDANEVVWI